MAELMELMTSVTKGNIEKAFSMASGLEREQFASNSWGFPFIPIPQHREISRGKFREAPTNISKQFLAHPIYHIDYELTKFDSDEEPEEQWCIRMYFLLLAFDLWDSSDGNIRWVDILNFKGVVLDDLTYEAYIQSMGGDFSSTRCKLDNMKDYGLPLTEDMMMMPWNKVRKQYNAVIVECDNRLQTKVNMFFEQQASAMQNALIYLGLESDLGDPNLLPNEPSGWWSKNLIPLLEDANTDYAIAFDKGIPKTKAAEKVVSLVDLFISQLLIMDETIALLNIPIVRTASTRSQAFSEMMSYLKLAIFKNESREDKYNYDEIIDELMNKEILSSEEGKLGIIPTLSSLAKALYNDYEKSWKRIRLTVANYKQLQVSAPPFVTYEDLFLFLSENNISESAEDDYVNNKIIRDAVLKNNEINRNFVGNLEEAEINYTSHKLEGSDFVIDSDDDLVVDFDVEDIKIKSNPNSVSKKIDVVVDFDDDDLDDDFDVEDIDIKY